MSGRTIFKDGELLNDRIVGEKVNKRLSSI